MTKLEDATYGIGVAGATTVEVLEFVDISVLNSYVYLAVLIVTLCIGLKKLIQRNKKE